MAESKLRELSTDLYNRCGTISRILVASINTAKENYDNAENIVKNDNTLYLYKAYLAYSQKDYKSVIA